MIHWRSLLLVGLGGFLGSLLRFVIGLSAQRLVGTSSFPLGTLCVNLVGCLAIGLVSGLLEAREPVWLPLRLFVVVGVLGGFTTFSAFGYETFALLKEGQALRAAASAALQVGLGILLVWGGHALALSALGPR